MRKKSHISLAGQLVNSLELEDIFDYKLPFYVGSIWPDCRPSFVTTPHRFDNTYGKIEQKLIHFVYSYDPVGGMNMRRSARLGVILHYIADYFTFPHNNHYEGNVKDHCIYERDLKHQLKAYLKTDDAADRKDQVETFASVGQLTLYIEEKHKEYMESVHDVDDDIGYIVDVCTSVVMSVLLILGDIYEEAQLRVHYA